MSDGEKKPPKSARKGSGKSSKKSQRRTKAKGTRARARVDKPTLRQDQREAKKAAIIEYLAESGDEMIGARKKFGVSRTTFYEWRRDDPVFERAISDAYREGVHSLVQEAKRRGFEGWDEPITYKGAITGKIRKFDSQLLMFLIRKREPAFRDPKYERPDDAPGAGGGSVDLLSIFRGCTPEELAVLERILARQAGGGPSL